MMKMVNIDPNSLDKTLIIKKLTIKTNAKNIKKRGKGKNKSHKQWKNPPKSENSPNKEYILKENDNFPKESQKVKILSKFLKFILKKEYILKKVIISQK